MDFRNTAIGSKEKIRVVAAKQLSQFNSKLSQGTTQRAVRYLNVLLPEPFGPANMRSRRVSLLMDFFLTSDHE